VINDPRCGCVDLCADERVERYFGTVTKLAWSALNRRAVASAACECIIDTQTA